MDIIICNQIQHMITLQGWLYGDAPCGTKFVIYLHHYSTILLKCIIFISRGAVTQKRIDVFSRNFAGMCTMLWGCAV